MNLCGVNISCHHLEDLLDLSQDLKLIVTVNAEAIVRAQSDDRLKNIINSHTSTIDGQIPLWLFRLKYPRHKIDKISGSDLIYSIPKFAQNKGLSVFLLGGQEGSNHGAIHKLQEKFPNLKINGYSPPLHSYPFPENINSSIINKLKEFKPDIIFVGFGMGKQEYWEEDNLEILESLGTKLIIGCGGSFEFASGKIKRAPVFIQNIGLEGVWRLLKEFKWFRIKRLLLSSKILYYYFIKK